MSDEGEGLFGNINVDNDLGDGNMIDTDEFVLDTTDDDDNNEPPTPNEGEGEGNNKDDNKDDDKEEADDSIDTLEFETDTTTTSGEDNTSVNDDSSADNSSSPLQLIASTLQAEGVIDLDDEVKIESSKQILDAVRKKIEENELADLTEDQKDYLSALRAGVPDEEIKQNLNNIKALEGITTENIESNEDLRRTLIAQDFIANGMAQAKAEKLADASVQLGNDLDDAKDAYASLTTLENTRIKKETDRLKEEATKSKVDADKRLESLKTTVLEQEEFIPGFKVNSSTKQKVYQNMTKVVSHDKQGNPLNALSTARVKDPEKIEMIENYLFTITKGFTDWTPFKNKAKSNAVKDLDSKLKGTQTGSGSSGKSVSSSAGGGLQNALDNLQL